jgi:hypothetical protein
MAFSIDGYARSKKGGSIDGQVNEMSLINDSEEAWAGSGSADYGRATEVLSGRD